MAVLRPRPAGYNPFQRRTTPAGAIPTVQTAAGPPVALPPPSPPPVFGGQPGAGEGHFAGIPRPTPTRVMVDPVNPGDFPAPSFPQYDTNRFKGDMDRFLAEYEDPRGTEGFNDLMALAGSRRARATEEETRRGQEVAARRGFVGGYDDAGERADREMQRANATAGFEAAGDIRRESGARYDAASGNYATMRRAAADAISARNESYFNALNQQRLAQAAADQNYERGLVDLYGADTRVAEGRTQAGIAERRAAEEQRQSQVDAVERQRQFEREDAERQRQFNLGYDLDRQRLDLPPSTYTGMYPGGAGGGGMGMTSTVSGGGGGSTPRTGHFAGLTGRLTPQRTISYGGY